MLSVVDSDDQFTTILHLILVINGSPMRNCPDLRGFKSEESLNIEQKERKFIHASILIIAVYTEYSKSPPLKRCNPDSVLTNLYDGINQIFHKTSKEEIQRIKIRIRQPHGLCVLRLHRVSTTLFNVIEEANFPTNLANRLLKNLSNAAHLIFGAKKWPYKALFLAAGRGHDIQEPHYPYPKVFVRHGQMFVELEAVVLDIDARKYV
ncbi:hypothetical protein ABEB36_009388 [Hypothenemus hampei]|uniref:Uncharacterized protein n=1 Tax=Hypothenemus hampei TaxID=57062 RepID=A0ABD1EGB7_HYPHA